jgi:hypothetical protein
MLALAVADPRMRRARVADAVTAAAFTATSALTGVGALRDTGAGGASAAVASTRPPG